MTATPMLHDAALDPLLRQALDQSSEAIAVYTAEEWVIASNVVYANRALEELSGYATTHFVGHSALLLAGARPDAAALASILPPAGAGELRTRVRKHRPDGSAYDVDVTVSALVDASGKVTHYVSTQRIAPTARVTTETVVGRVRDASFAQLAAGVAYEFEGLAARCTSRLDEALELSAGAPSLVPALESAQRAAASMAATVRGLKAFTTEEGNATAQVNVHDALELALRLAGPVVRERATIERRYSPVGPVKASLPRLTRLFTSLLTNAGESIPGSMPDANHVVLQTSADAHGEVSVIITDTGIGIESTDLPFVFDPFFTTKKDAATHGLGLTAVRAELSQLGGDICIESIVGRGTRVRVTLPAAVVRPVASLPLLVTEEAPPSRILSVADSHAAAVEVSQPFVDGPVVVVVATWAEALERLTLAERFDLVVCDARSALADAFRARLREAAPDCRTRVFDVSLVAPERSGIFPRAVAPAYVSAEGE